MTKKNKFSIVAVVIIILLVAFIIYKMNNKVPRLGTIQDKPLKCCDPLTENYDPDCEADPDCQCSAQACQYLTGRTACCSEVEDNYDPTCVGDPDCYCDQAQCGLGGDPSEDPCSEQFSVGSACCVSGAINYNSCCNMDIACGCDNTLCQYEDNSNLCYTECLLETSSYNQIMVTVPCGTGVALNYPNYNAPDCNVDIG